MSDSNKALNGMCHGRALLFIFRGVDVQPGLFFIVAEEGIDPAPDRVSRQEAVIGPDPAKPLINGYGKGFPGVDGMVQSPVHDNNQDPFFFRFSGIFCPECPVFLITGRIEELAVERVVPLPELM